MVIEDGLSAGEAPNSISFPSNNIPTKEPHHCKFDDCLNPKKGFGDFCRQHKAIGKIIAGKIAREKANSVDPSMSKYDEALRIQESASSSVFVEEMMKIILGVAVLFLFLYIFVVLPYRGFIDIIMGRT